MNLKSWKHNQKTHYLITIEDSELAQIPLDEFDRELLRECEISDHVSDKLLALEALSRKIERLHEDS